MTAARANKVRAAGLIGRTVVSGLGGTSAMTMTTSLQSRRLRRRSFVDYDATEHVVTAASAVLRWKPQTEKQRTALFMAVHWGYGSGMAAVHVILANRLPRPVASVAFFGICQLMAFTLFPAFGGTPPPWRWRRGVLVSSLGQHLVYVVTVSLMDRVLVAAAQPTAADGDSAGVH